MGIKVQLLNRNPSATTQEGQGVLPVSFMLVSYYALRRVGHHHDHADGGGSMGRDRTLHKLFIGPLPLQRRRPSA